MSLLKLPTLKNIRSGKDVDCDKQCEGLKNLEIKVEAKFKEYEKRLSEGSINFAIITTKLNVVLAIISAIGLAMAAFIVEIVLK